MTTARAVARALACAAVLAACGGEGSKDARSLCLEEAAAVAARTVDCVPADPAFAARWFPAALECEAAAEMQAAGTLGVDASRLGDCLAAVKALGCNELRRLEGELPEACRGVLVPRVEPGGACHSPSGVECVDGWCNVAACNQPGTCVAYAHQGDSCFAARCAPGLWCPDGTCQPLLDHLAGLDQPCGTVGSPCAEGLYCKYDSATLQLTCRPQVAIGGDCSVTYEACPPGSNCRSRNDGGGAVCVPGGAAGARCAPGLATCDRGLVCVPDDAAGLTGVCTAWPGLGGACGLTAQEEYAGCAEGYCGVPIVTALAPGRLVAAAGSLVISGTCQPFKALGDACSPPDLGQCGSLGACVDGACQRSYCGGVTVRAALAGE